MGQDTVDIGRIVICTIHQRDIDIFEAFDEVQIQTTQFFCLCLVLLLTQMFEYFTPATIDEARRVSDLLMVIGSAFSQVDKVF